MPNTIMKDRIAVLAAMANSTSAIWGRILLSRPTIPPTNALIMTKRVNCCQFSFRPNLTFSIIIFLL
jgi:hypothetical protein